MIARLLIAVLLVSIGFGRVTLPAMQVEQTLHVELSDDDHAALHEDGVGHRHDNSGDYQKDGSDEGLRHVLGDLGHGPFAFAAPMMVPAPHATEAQRVMFHDTDGHPPDRDGLKRPPRTLT